MDYFLRCQLSVCWVIQMKGNKGSLPEKSRGLAGHLFVGVEEATGNPKMEDWMASQWAASSWDHGEETKVQLSLFSNWCSHFFLHSLFSFWLTDNLKETLFCFNILVCLLNNDDIIKSVVTLTQVSIIWKTWPICSQFQNWFSVWSAFSKRLLKMKILFSIGLNQRRSWPLAGPADPERSPGPSQSSACKPLFSGSILVCL